MRLSTSEANADADTVINLTSVGVGTAHTLSGGKEYIIGTSSSAETVYEVPANKRVFVLFGTAADRAYTFGVAAYRAVDRAVNTSGVINSVMVKPLLVSENPYIPARSIAFAGNVTGTVNGIAANNVNVWSAIAGTGKPEDGATVGAKGSNVGGGNLVLNAGFGAYSGTLPTGWQSYNDGGTSVGHGGLTGEGLFGTNAHRVNAIASTASMLGICTNIATTGGVRAWTAGREHVISFYARAMSAGAVGVQMNGTYSNMGFTNPVAVANPGLVLGVWQRYIFRVVPNNNAYTSTGELYLSWDVQGTLPAGAIFDICAVQVQSGDFATEWAETAISARNPITSGNASTYISNLAVNTLQIANNAVTVPTSANAENTVTITPEGGYVLFAPTINSQGGMTTILVGVSLSASSASLIFGVRVYRNGAFLKEFESSGSANHFATFVLTDVFNGDASYGLFIYKKYSALLAGSVKQRTLIVSGAKR